MTPVEDRTRAAMDAITDLVENVPPLPLPPPPAIPSRRRRLVPAPRRRWGSWLAPAAAAAAVLAVAATLVVVRNMPDGRPATVPVGPVLPTAFPDYYLTFSQPRGDTTKPVGLVLGQTLTGKKLFTLQPPKGLSFAGITAAADDRTFVADAQRDPYGAAGSEGRSRAWYLVRVTGSGTEAALTMEELPIPTTPVGTDIAAIALSPDGTKLAVATQPYGDAPVTTPALTVYSVATGAVLRTWSSAASQPAPIEGGGGEGGDDNSSLSWVGDRALAFFSAEQKGPGSWAAGVFELPISHPDGDILASSRLVVPVTLDNSEKRTPFGCGDLYRSDVLITGDAAMFVCGGEGTSDAKLPPLACAKGPDWNTVGFAGYSLATGKLTRFLSAYKTACYGEALSNPYPLWVSPTGSTVIGYMYLGFGRQMFGVFSHGSFRPLPIPEPGNWYQYGSGTLLFQVAW